MFSRIEEKWFFVKFSRTWPSTEKLNHFMDVISARQVESPIILICYAGPDPTALSHTNKSPFLISIWCFFQSSGPKVTDRKRRETDCFVAAFPWVFLITSPWVERPELMPCCLHSLSPSVIIELVCISGCVRRPSAQSYWTHLI